MGFFDKLKGIFGSPPEKAAPPAKTESAAPKESDSEAVPPTPSEASQKPRATAETDARLERDARAAYAADRASAIALLDARAVLFAKHEPTALPCLCKACLRPELDEAEAEGILYVRDFVVTKNRVLFYWTPRELESRVTQVRASMRSALRQRLRELRTKEEEPRTAINPFTKQPVVIQPRSKRRPRINPFTGKRIP